MIIDVNYICIITKNNINKMTETYEEFIIQKIDDLDYYTIIDLYNDYEENATNYFQYDNNFVLFEDSDEWFSKYFISFITSYKYRSWIDDYQLIRVDRCDNFVFKKQLINNYSNNAKYDKHVVMFLGNENDDEYHLKTEINENFINTYIYNILDFNHFKNILYDNDIYNEVFAPEVELK
jgi:hypothetical protein